MPGSLLVRSGVILTMNDRLEIVSGDVAIRDGRIEAVGRVDPDARYDRVVDAGGGYVLPGLIQTHIHLCQTLFRGSADDLPLLEWLRRRVWPMEAAHNPASLRAAAQLAALELLTSGTTAVLTMETVHDTDVVFEAVAEIGPARDDRQGDDGCGAGGAAASAGRHPRVARREPLDCPAVGWRGGRTVARGAGATLCRVLLGGVAAIGRGAVGRARPARAHACVRIARRDRGRRAAVTGLGNLEYLVACPPGQPASLRGALRVG